ncbi:ImmA/IrrE family metallo-endopeptidase [Deinococcus sp. VB343]|uniref:ImmA/IrrE family metallo-endopeptidase n=1 Tax=Deinococcus sp. VB343 TaxID=3385567 RepID=UPI0039C952EC
MRDATRAAIEFAQRLHAQHDFETDPEKLSHLLGIRIIPGKENRAAHGPPSIITRAADAYAPRQRFTMHHEIAHIVIQRSGLEDAVKAEVDPDDADDHLELVANYIGALLVMPDPLIVTSLERHGLTPEAILDIRDRAQVSFAAAIRRFTTANVDEPTTVFISGDSYVLDLASTDPYNRIQRYQRMPDARAEYPNAELLTLRQYIKPRTIGVLTW